MCSPTNFWKDACQKGLDEGKLDGSARMVTAPGKGIEGIPFRRGMPPRDAAVAAT